MAKKALATGFWKNYLKISGQLTSEIVLATVVEKNILCKGNCSYYSPHNVPNLKTQKCWLKGSKEQSVDGELWDSGGTWTSLKGRFVRIGCDWRLRKKRLYCFVSFRTERTGVFVLSECLGKETSFRSVEATRSGIKIHPLSEISRFEGKPKHLEL